MRRSSSRHRNRSNVVRAISVVAIIAGSATLATACGDDEAARGGAPTTAPTAITSNPTSTTSGASTSAGTSTSVGTGASLPTTGNPEIDALLAKERTANYHVVYLNHRSETLEVFRDGAQLAVYQGTQSLHQTGDGKNYQCDTIEGGRCLSLPDGLGTIDAVLTSIFTGFGAALAGSESATNPFAAGTTIAEETVAGRPGRCATVTSEGQSFSVCIDAEIGILLRSVNDQGNGLVTTFAASTVEVGTVSADDLALPAAIIGD